MTAIVHVADVSNLTIRHQVDPPERIVASPSLHQRHLRADWPPAVVDRAVPVHQFAQHALRDIRADQRTIATIDNSF